MATAETAQSTKAERQVELTADLRSAVFQLAWLYRVTEQIQEDELVVSDIIAVPPSVDEDAQWDIIRQTADRALEHLESNEDLIVGYAMSGKGKQASVSKLIQEALEISCTTPLRNRTLLEIEEGLELLDRFGQQGATPQAADAIHDRAETLSTAAQRAIDDLVEYGLLPMKQQASKKQSAVVESLQDIRELTLPEIDGKGAYINAEAASQALPLLSSSASELLLHLSQGIVIAGKDHEGEMHVPWETPGSAFSSPTLRTPLPNSALRKASVTLVEQPPLSASLARDGLCCALGLIGWKDEEASDAPRLAPLLLQPAEVNSDGKALTLSSAPAMPVVNPVLKQLLSERYSLELPEYQESANFVEYIREIRQKIKGSRADLQVFDRAILLELPEPGVVYSDLAPDQWPRDRQATNHAVIRQLLLGKIQVIDEEALSTVSERMTHYRNSPPIAAFPESYEAILAQAARGESIDLADALSAEQRKAVIVAAIAEAAWNGRPALVISPREETLTSIEEGLTEMGLQGLATRIRESSDQSPDLHDMLKARLLKSKPRVPSPAASMEKLQKKEGELKDSFAVYHDYEQATGQRASDTVAALLRHDPNEMTFSFKKMKNWDQATYQEKQRYVDQFSDMLQRIGNPTNNCFYGAQRSASLHGFEVKKLIDAATVSTETLKESLSGFLETFGLSESGSLDQESQRIALLQALTEFIASDNLESFKGCNLNLIDSQSDLLKQLTLAGRLFQIAEEKMPEGVAQEEDPENIREVREVLSEYQGSWVRFISPRYWRTRSEAKRMLPDEFPASFADRLEALDSLVKANENRVKLEERSVLLDKAFGQHHKGPSDTDWGFLSRATLFLQSVKSSLENNPEEKTLKEFLTGARAIPEGALEVARDTKAALEQYTRGIEELTTTLKYPTDSASCQFFTTNFDAQEALLRTWSEKADTVKELTKYNEAAAEMKEAGLSFVCNQAESWSESYENFASAFEYTWLRGLLETNLSGDDASRGARSEAYQRTLEEHTAAQQEAISIGQKAYALKHWKMMQTAEKAKDRDSLRESIACDREDFTPREFFACKSSRLIAPVVLGSPEAVAKNLPRDAYFQLCVTDFDDGKREELATTLGGLQRSSQLVMFSPFSDDPEDSTRSNSPRTRHLASPLAVHIQRILEEDGIEIRTGAEVNGVAVSLGVLDPRDSSRVLFAVQIDDEQYLSVPSARDRDYLPRQKLKEAEVPMLFSSSLSWFDDFIAGSDSEKRRILDAVPAEARKE